MQASAQPVELQQKSSAHTVIFRKFCHIVPPQPDAFFALRGVGSLRYNIAIRHAAELSERLFRSNFGHETLETGSNCGSDNALPTGNQL